MKKKLTKQTIFNNDVYELLHSAHLEQQHSVLWVMFVPEAGINNALNTNKMSCIILRPR